MKKILLVLCMALMLCGCSKGKTASITLKGNPTTGYEWTYSFSNEGVLKEKSNNYITDNENLTGSGGKYDFVFEGEKEGTTKIIFEYKRSWETEEPLYTLTYEITVNNKKEIKSSKVTGNYSEDKLPEAVIK